MTLKDMAAEFGALRFWIGVIVVLTLSLNGVFQFLKDAPAVVSTNTRGVEGNAQEISHLYDSVNAISPRVDAFEVHMVVEDSIHREQSEEIAHLGTNVDYLVCLRQERARELDSLPRLRNCEEVLLSR